LFRWDNKIHRERRRGIWPEEGAAQHVHLLTVLDHAAIDQTGDDEDSSPAMTAPMVTFFNVFSYYPPICVTAEVAAMTAVAIDGRAAVSKNLDFL
jgi:hypothetical protein